MEHQYEFKRIFRFILPITWKSMNTHIFKGSLWNESQNIVISSMITIYYLRQIHSRDMGYSTGGQNYNVTIRVPSTLFIPSHERRWDSKMRPISRSHLCRHVSSCRYFLIQPLPSQTPFHLRLLVILKYNKSYSLLFI